MSEATTFDGLQALLGPSESDCPRVPWEQVESELSLVLPSDYRAWCGVYPTIEVDDGLLVHNFATRAGEELVGPDVWREGLLLVLDSVAVSLEHPGLGTVLGDSGEVLETEAPALPVYPEPGGLLPWGNTPDNEVFMWSTEGHPDEWPTWVTDDANQWWCFPGRFTDLLSGLLTGEVTCPLLDPDWPVSPAFTELVGTDHHRLLDGRVQEVSDMRPTSRWRAYFEKKYAEDGD